MTKTILITGATAGIGAASARRFAAGGWRVIATGRRGDRRAVVAGAGALVAGAAVRLGRLVTWCDRRHSDG